MQRTFTLEPNEQRVLAGLEQENTNTLARVGAIMLDLETARQQLAMVQEKQRGFLREAMTARHIEQFQEARVINGQIVAQLPDEILPAPTPITAAKDGPVNGAIHDRE
jgi:hypothetical protein